ncbi:uncharacterized protein LOC134777205 [Penaeus indicus]|uniref:uncharacterized protein LOC134777205 n=1 Tax=Penaeus indicus TaxID=29960 RepID=UPI00300DAA28
MTLTFISSSSRERLMYLKGKKVPKRLNVSKLKSDHSNSTWLKKLRVDWTPKLLVLGISSLNGLSFETSSMLQSQRGALLNDTISASKKAAFSNSKRTVQLELCQMQDTWLSQKADEIQSYAKHNDMKFYSALKSVYGPTSSGSSPLFGADGDTLITDREMILECWAEHFDSVLNSPFSINDEAIERLPQAPTNHALADVPTEEEVKKAVNRLFSGKAPGADSIPAEIYASGGPQLIRRLTELFQSMWFQEKLPQEFKDVSVVHLYKRKGNRQACDNHRGISLLSVAGKILDRVLLNRLIQHLEQGLLPESQCRFRQGTQNS